MIFVKVYQFVDIDVINYEKSGPGNSLSIFSKRGKVSLQEIILREFKWLLNFHAYPKILSFTNFNLFC